MSKKWITSSCIIILALCAVKTWSAEFSEFRDRSILPVVTETAEGWSADGGDYALQLNTDGTFVYSLGGKTLSLRFDSVRYSRDIGGATREWVLIGEPGADFALTGERAWTGSVMGGVYEIAASRGKVKHTLTFPAGWKVGLPDAAEALGEIRTATGQVLTYPVEIGWVWAVQDMELGANPDAYDEVREWKGAGLLGTNGAEIARLLPNTINGLQIETSWLWIGDGIGFIWAHCLLSELPDGAFELDPSLVTLTYSEVLDTYVDSANPAVNYESATQLYADKTKRALWKIDYAAVSGTVISASVGLYQTGGAAADVFRVMAYPTFSTGATWASGYTASATGGPWFEGDDTDGWHWIDLTLWAGEIGEPTNVIPGNVSDATTATWADTGVNVDEDRRFTGESVIEMPGGTIALCGGTTSSKITVWSPTAETFTDKALIAASGYLREIACARVGNTIYGFGGTTGAATSTYWKYDASTGVKTHLGYMVSALEGMCACTLPQGSVLVAQGIGASATSAAFIFTPTNQVISYITPSNEADWCASLETAGDGYVYRYGGFDGDGKSFEKFDPSNNTWTLLSDGTVARAMHSCYRTPSGNLGFIGGDYTTTNTSHQVYSVTSATWLTRDALPVALSECGAMIVGSTSAGLPSGSTVFVFGGYNGVLDIFCLQYEGAGGGASERIRRSLEIRTDDAASGYFYSNDYGNSTYRPTLRILTASAGEPVVSVTDFTAQSNSTTYDDYARLTVQPASRPEAARWLNFGGYLGGQFNGEWIGKEAFSWDGFVGPNRYNSYAILGASFPTGVGWISLADTSGNTDVQWSFSSGGGGGGSTLTAAEVWAESLSGTAASTRLVGIDTNIDANLSTVQDQALAHIAAASAQEQANTNQALVHIAAATNEIGTVITNSRNQISGMLADATALIEDASNSIGPFARAGAGILLPDLIQWNQVHSETSANGQTAVQVIGRSLGSYDPASATFTAVVNRAATTAPLSPPVLGYNNDQASGLNYQTSEGPEDGILVTRHFLSANIEAASDTGLYQMTIVQKDTSGNLYHCPSLHFVHSSTPTVDTSALATLADFSAMKADLMETATQPLKVWTAIASATEEKTDPTSEHDALDTHFIAGVLAAEQYQYYNADTGTWENGPVLIYDYHNNTNQVAETIPGATWQVTGISQWASDAGVSGKVSIRGAP